MDETIITICYGRERKWSSREEAIVFFKEGVYESDGAEKCRYANILVKLLDGLTVCSDSD